MALFEGRFPYTNFHDLNLDWLLQKVQDHEERLTQAEQDIDALEGRMDQAEADIDTLEGRMDTAEDDIDALEGRMDTAEDDIDALEGRMDTAEGDIDALEGRMDTAEGDIDALEKFKAKSLIPCRPYNVISASTPDFYDAASATVEVDTRFAQRAFYYTRCGQSITVNCHLLIKPVNGITEYSLSMLWPFFVVKEANIASVDDKPLAPGFSMLDCTHYNGTTDQLTNLMDGSHELCAVIEDYHSLADNKTIYFDNIVNAISDLSLSWVPDSGDCVIVTFGMMYDTTDTDFYDDTKWLTAAP